LPAQAWLIMRGSWWSLFNVWRSWKAAPDKASRFTTSSQKL
jgi:hypothetical protein